MRRRLFNIAAAVSLVLLTLSPVLWVRSYSREAAVCWVRDAPWSDKGISLPPLGNSEWCLGIRGGQIHLSYHYPAVGAPAPGIRYEGQPYFGSDGKWFSLESISYPTGFRTFEWEFPLASVVVVLATLPLSNWLRRWHNSRKAAIDHPRCTCCSYNLTANTSGVCPECGTTIPNEPEAVA